MTVVDRQPEAGLETSFANGGQISVSHAEPWSNPHAPMRALSWMGREGRAPCCSACAVTRRCSTGAGDSCVNARRAGRAKISAISCAWRFSAATNSGVCARKRASGTTTSSVASSMSTPIRRSLKGPSRQRGSCVSSAANAIRSTPTSAWKSSPPCGRRGRYWSVAITPRPTSRAMPLCLRRSSRNCAAHAEWPFASVRQSSG